MKFSFPQLLLLVLALSACKSKTRVEDHPPGMDPLRFPVKEDLPPAVLGQWERCDSDKNKGKSILTRVTIQGGLEIKEMHYDDPYCQLIDSTKERTIISYYYFTYEDQSLRAKIQERKLVLHQEKDVERYNAKGICGHRDWRTGKTRDVLGVPCTGLPRDNKHDLTVFTLKPRKKDLLFQNKSFAKAAKSYRVNEGEAPPKLVNSTSSEVRPESGGGRVMLVYPPVNGEMKVAVGNTNHPNQNLCDATVNTYLTAKKAWGKIAKERDELRDLEAQEERFQEEISAAIAEHLKFVEDNDLQEYDQLQKERESLNEALEIAEADHRNCEGDCDPAWERVKKLREQSWELNRKINSMRIHRRVLRNYHYYVANIEKVEERHKNHQQSILIKKRQLQEALDRHLQVFEGLDGKEAGLGLASFTGEWGRNLKTLIDANPKLRFRKAPIEKVTLTYRLLGLSNYPGHTSILGIPELETSSLVRGRLNLKEYPESITGAVSLSLLAVCPALDPESFGLKLTSPRTLDFALEFSYKSAP